MRKLVGKREEPRQQRLLRLAGGIALVGLMSVGAVPVGGLIFEARSSAKLAACDAAQSMVERAERVALITRRSLAQSVRDHRWGEPAQREYLASATADLRQVAIERQRQADTLHAAWDALRCER